MAQGTRGRWLRGAAVGLGVVLCTGLVGCMNTDKDKKDKLPAKQPSPGLTGTPLIPPGSQSISKTGGSPGFGTGYGNGSGIQQTGGTTPSRVGSSGVNTLSSPPQTSLPSNYGNSSAQPGSPGTIGAPAQPNFVPSVEPPAGGFGSANPSPNSNSMPKTTALSANENTPSLLDVPLPPPPREASTAAATTPPVVQPPSSNSQLIAPSLAPLAPLAPPGTSTALSPK
ncbi:hypothetical protein [Gemmata massiliana]|nr:hypothetical protein [Gemmata massiliana]